MRDRLHAELVSENYEKRQADKTWKQFREEYEASVLPGLEYTTRREIIGTLDRFDRIAKPRRVSSVTAQMIASFTAKRRLERGKNPGSTVSPATVNKDLRNLRGVLNIAVDWEYLAKAPKIKFEREPKKLPRYVTPEHFGAIYQACDVARLPAEVPYPVEDWWRGLLTMAQMTGWRIGELLALQWTDVDLVAETAITRHHDNKGHRDGKIAIHPVVIDHLRKLRCFDALVFPWSHDRRTLYTEFARIQDKAGIHLPCPDAKTDGHGECTPACHRYSFHDERRAFATMNAPNMTREALQVLMRHASPDTTDRYINMAQQLNPAVASLHVPDVLQVGNA